MNASSAASLSTVSDLIPVLDIKLYHTNRNAFVSQLGWACHNIGFFQLKHNIPSALVHQMLNEARLFFEQPLSRKMEISYEENAAFRGYMPIGLENTAGIVDAREQIEYAVEAKKGDKQETKMSKWPIYERLRGTNPYPCRFQPSLKDCVQEYVQQVCAIAELLRKALCLALRLEETALDALFVNDEDEEPHWAVKLISYPYLAIRAPGLGENATEESNTLQNLKLQGVGPHTDTNFLTLVLQDDVGGLQVHSQGGWHDVPTNLGTSVHICNLGEQAEILSNGYFLATPHRVKANTFSSRIAYLSHYFIILIYPP